jgi:hypothetical protein
MIGSIVNRTNFMSLPTFCDFNDGQGTHRVLQGSLTFDNVSNRIEPLTEKSGRGVGHRENLPFSCTRAHLHAQSCRNGRSMTPIGSSQRNSVTNLPEPSQLGQVIHSPRVQNKIESNGLSSEDTNFSGFSDEAESRTRADARNEDKRSPCQVNPGKKWVSGAD